MSAILIHFLDGDIPVVQFVGDSDREVAFLRDWLEKNLNIKAEGRIPEPAPGESAPLAGGYCGRLCATISKTPATSCFHLEG